LTPSAYHRPEAAARLPENVEVVTGDLTEPESLDAGLRGVGAVFQQPPPMAVLHADIERLIAAAGLESTILRPGGRRSRRRVYGRSGERRRLRPGRRLAR
jgi:uncharacterized protein YbjT (DUF2867 family)